MSKGRNYSNSCVADKGKPLYPFKQQKKKERMRPSTGLKQYVKSRKYISVSPSLRLPTDFSVASKNAKKKGREKKRKRKTTQSKLLCNTNALPYQACALLASQHVTVNVMHEERRSAVEG